MVEMTLEPGLEGTAGFHSMESFLGRQQREGAGTHGEHGAGCRCTGPLNSWEMIKYPSVTFSRQNSLNSKAELLRPIQWWKSQILD